MNKSNNNNFKEVIKEIANKNSTKSEFLGVLDMKDINYTVNNHTIRVYNNEEDEWIMCFAAHGHIIVR